MTGIRHLPNRMRAIPSQGSGKRTHGNGGDNLEYQQRRMVAVENSQRSDLHAAPASKCRCSELTTTLFSIGVLTLLPIDADRYPADRDLKSSAQTAVSTIGPETFQQQPTSSQKSIPQPRVSNQPAPSAEHLPPGMHLVRLVLEQLSGTLKRNPETQSDRQRSPGDTPPDGDRATGSGSFSHQP